MLSPSSADALAMPVRSYLEKFRDEFEEHVRREGCWYPAFDVAPAHNTFWEDATAEVAR